MNQQYGQDVYSQRMTDKHLDAESAPEVQAERFNMMCIDTVKDYVDTGWGDHTATDLIWEALSESFNDKQYGTAGVDLLIKQIVSKELDGIGSLSRHMEIANLSKEIGGILTQGIINYLLKQAAEDVANELNLCSCSIEPDQHIISTAH